MRNGQIERSSLRLVGFQDIRRDGPLWHCDECGLIMISEDATREHYHPVKRELREKRD